MQPENTDVVADALASLGTDTGATITPGASDQNDNLASGGGDTAKDIVIEGASERANARIRELTAELERAKATDRVVDSASTVKLPDEMEAFLNSVADEPSRQMLRQFSQIQSKVYKESTIGELAPLLEKSRADRFENEISNWEKKLPELGPYRDSMRKTYMRDTSIPIENLVRDVTFKIRTGTAAPIESASSSFTATAQRTSASEGIESQINALITAGRTDEAIALSKKHFGASFNKN
jgi:hypothetical protein